MGDATIFDKYFSLPVALAGHKSAPLVRERDQFLAHLEATGTRRSAICIASTYLFHVVTILRLHRLRDVTLEDIDRAADQWNTLRNHDKQYAADNPESSSLLKPHGDSCASIEDLSVRNCPIPSGDSWMT